jgi:hypothetical protein
VFEKSENGLPRSTSGKIEKTEGTMSTLPSQVKRAFTTLQREKELIPLPSHYPGIVMPPLPSVFISYNPNSEFEQTLAIRLHTIGAVHGLNMLMPDRTHYSYDVSPETRNRILLSDFFIVFSTGMMSLTVQEEIRIAFSKLHDRSKILVVYDKSLGKNLVGADNCTEVFIDPKDDPLKIVTDISERVKSFQVKKGGDSFVSSLAGLLLIGLGLFALNEAFNDEPKPRKRPVKKAAKKKKRS